MQKSMETMEPKEKEIVLGDIGPIFHLIGFNIRSTGNFSEEAKRLVMRETVSSTWHWSP